MIVIKALWGDWREGCLSRQEYLLGMIWLITIRVLIFHNYDSMDGDVFGFNNTSFGPVPFCKFLLSVAAFNISSKRLRDMGFPGWLPIGLIGLVFVVLPYVGATNLAFTFGPLMGLALILYRGASTR